MFCTARTTTINRIRLFRSYFHLLMFCAAVHRDRPNQTENDYCAHYRSGKGFLLTTIRCLILLPSYIWRCLLLLS
jgi:hypothetical protein